VVAGPDTPEATAYRLDLPRPRHDKLSDFRVLVLDRHPMLPTAGTIREALTGLASRLAQAGCKVGREDEALPDLSEAARMFTALLMSFMGADMPERDYEAVASQASAGARKREPGEPDRASLAMSHRDWIRLDRERLEMSARWRRVFANWDIVLCPIAPVTAFRHDERPFGERTLTVDGKEIPYGLMPIWTSIGTPTGQPVTAMPIGLDPAGLPIGVQAIGPRFEDRTTLAFAAQAEQAFGGFVPPPGYA
jgi:amidase